MFVDSARTATNEMASYQEILPVAGHYLSGKENATWKNLSSMWRSIAHQVMPAIMDTNPAVCIHDANRYPKKKPAKKLRLSCVGFARFIVNTP